MATAVDLSIIIPAYKEHRQIEPRLKALAEFLQTRDYGAVEVLVMAQSDDDTGAAARVEAKLFDRFRVINLGKRAGKGGAVRAGMFEAEGRYRLFMDADLATPLVHLDEVWRIMESGGMVAIAVRSLGTIHKSYLRKIITVGGNLLAQVIILPGIKDTQCGFKAFRASAATAIFGRQTILGWGFDMEILAIARRLGYSIETFPADDWRDPKAEGLVGDSPVGAALQVFKDLLRIRLNLWAGRYRYRSYHYEAG